jgi:hypothetical protein
MSKALDAKINNRLNYYQLVMHLFLSFDFMSKERKPDDHLYQHEI